VNGVKLLNIETGETKSDRIDLVEHNGFFIHKVGFPSDVRVLSFSDGA
jgi:hypothetical protein